MLLRASRHLRRPIPNSSQCQGKPHPICRAPLVRPVTSPAASPSVARRTTRTTALAIGMTTSTARATSAEPLVGARPRRALQPSLPKEVRAVAALRPLTPRTSTSLLARKVVNPAHRVRCWAALRLNRTRRRLVQILTCQVVLRVPRCMRTLAICSTTRQA